MKKKNAVINNASTGITGGYKQGRWSLNHTRLRNFLFLVKPKTLEQLKQNAGIS